MTARRRGGLSGFALAALASTALTAPTAALAVPPSQLILTGDYIKIGLNGKGTLGVDGNTSPGILYDGTGTGTFNTAYDYLTPGSPFEGFTISGKTTSTFTATNNNDDLSSATISGTLTDYSGVAQGGETFDQRAIWTGTYSGAVTVSHDYRFNNGGQQLTIVTTVTALTDVTELGFARFTDPDAVAAAGDSSATNNFQGATGVATSNLVYAEATVSKYVIGLYSGSTVTHNTAVTGWTTDVGSYLAGTSIGDGDNTIGLAFDIGSLLTGESITLNYSYIFGTNIANAVADAGAGGGGTPTPAGPTPIDSGAPSTVEDLLSGKVTPVFDGGVLTMASNGEVDTDFTVKAIGGGIDTDGHDLTLSGALTGAGVLEKSGGGVLTLTGENTHGGFDVKGGVLAFGSDAALGSGDRPIEVSGGATLRATENITVNHGLKIDSGEAGGFDTGAHDVVLAGDITGGGALNKDGTGVLTLTGANSFTTLEVRQGGVMADSSQALGAADGHIVLHQDTAFTAGANLVVTQNVEVAGDNARFNTGANNVTLTGALSGKACLIKAGTGSLNLAAAASNDIGACVEEGRLAFNSVFTGKVWVEAGGQAGGSGKVVGDVEVEGVLAPGNSPGQLVVAGSVTQAASGVLALDIDGPTAGIGAGHYDTLVLIGAGSIYTAAGTIAPILRGITGAANNTYVPTIGDTFQVVTAEGGVTGAYATVAQPTAGLPANSRFDVVYLPKAVVLAVTPNSYAALASGVTNARTMGVVADALRPAAASRGTSAFTNGLAGLKEAQLAAVLHQASGEIHADSVEAQLQSQRAARGQVAGRLTDGFATQRRVWGEYGADNFKLDGDTNAGGFDSDRTAMIFGVDGRVSDTLLAGTAFSYGETDMDGAAMGSAETTSYQGHVYGAWRSGDYYVNGLVSAGTDTYKTARRVSLSTGVTAYAGRADGSSLAADLEAGRDFKAGPALITLAAGLAGDRVKRDAMTETGSTAASLVFDGETRQALQGRIGARVSAQAAMGALKLSPRAAVFVSQEFDDTATRLGARLQGQAFEITTADAGRTAVSLAAGLDASLTNRLRVGIGYRYGWSDGGESHAAQVRAAITW